MPQDQSSDHDLDDPDSEFVEIDPSGRYGRYKEVLGRGAFKKVYRGFDELEGIEVAWNQVKVADVLRNSEDLDRLYSEVHLLKTLKHKNIIKFYNSWVDNKNENINFITEIFTSGTLRQYRKKHKHVDLRALKKWSRQILEGLLYLHSHDPPVIHRDLKCDNIFVNGNQGEVKIGDLGLAAILCQARSAHSVIGTPEFMAPELYEEEYNELVDIYAFGMCLLELVTFEYPYAECANAAQIYKKVTSGIKPASLTKVEDPQVKAFIDKCIAKVSERLSAKDLLMDPFLHSENDHGSLGRPIQPNHQLGGVNDNNVISTIGKDDRATTIRDLTVQGQRRDANTIYLKLRMADSSGNFRNIHFPFDIEEDTSIAVASEMVQELDLTDQDVTAIAAMIDSEIRSLIPGWSSNEIHGDEFDEETPHRRSFSETREAASPAASPATNSLTLERFPSGRRYWCTSPKVVPGSSPLRPAASHLSSQAALITNGDGSSANCPGSADEGVQRICYDVTKENAEESTTSQPGDDHQTGNHYATNVGKISEANAKGGIKSEDISRIAKNLEDLLIRQEKELDELRRKHKLEVSDVLKEFHPETQTKIINMCELNKSFELGNCQPLI